MDSFVIGTRFLTTNERHRHEKRPFRCSRERLSRLSVFSRLSIRTRQWNGARPSSIGSIRRFPPILSVERETCRN